jgi:hypothetical protein
MVPRNDIFEGFHSRFDTNAWPDPWPDSIGLDYVAWQFTARALDVRDGAKGGCKSCEVLQKGVELLGKREWFEDERMSLQVIFCHGRVMRVYIMQMDAVEEEDGDDEDGMFSGFGGMETSLTGEVLEILEFYTLTGKPAQVPTDLRLVPVSFELYFRFQLKRILSLLT